MQQFVSKVLCKRKPIKNEGNVRILSYGKGSWNFHSWIRFCQNANHDRVIYLDLLMVDQIYTI